MAGVACIAQQMGFIVTGSDENVYPPMSTVLDQAGIQYHQGYVAEDIPATVDCVVIGNAMKRGNPAVEYVLREKIFYQSGPAWLSENVLQHKHVLGSVWYAR